MIAARKTCFEVVLDMRNKGRVKYNVGLTKFKTLCFVQRGIDCGLVGEDKHDKFLDSADLVALSRVSRTVTSFH